MINDMICAYCLLGMSLRDRPRSGQPKCTSPAQDAAIVQYVRDNPLTNTSKTRQALGLDVSLKTIRRRLAEFNLHCHTPAVKERLNDRHRAERLAFSRTFVTKPRRFWEETIFR